VTFSYGADPATSELDAVRFHLGDTIQDDPLLSDEEILYVLAAQKETVNSPIWAAAVCAEGLSNRFARELNVVADGVNIPAGELMERFNQVALNLREQFHSERGMDVFAEDFAGVLENAGWIASLAPLNFGLGMHDNPEAGNQEQGRVGGPFYPDQLEAQLG
jgi:hypothetical protein